MNAAVKLPSLAAMLPLDERYALLYLRAATRDEDEAPLDYGTATKLLARGQIAHGAAFGTYYLTGDGDSVCQELQSL